MSNSGRSVAAVAAVVVMVIAFVVLSPGDDDEPTTSVPPPVATAPATTPTGTTTTTTPPPPPPPARPAYETIRVRGGKPVGGVQRITVEKGDRARIQVSSPDTTDEIHLHGYDISRDLKAGGRVRFNFTADADGIYEIELEGAGVQIGELVVEP